MHYIALEQSGTQQTRFTRHALSHHTPSHTLEGYPNTMLLNTHLGDYNQRVAKLAQRAQTRLHAIATFFQTDTIIPEDVLFADITGLSTAREYSLYPQVRMNNHCYFLGSQGSAHFPASLETFQEVTFVSGVCLFSEQALYGRDVQGNHVNLLVPGQLHCEGSLQELVHDTRISFYEHEAIARLSRCIADVIASAPATPEYKIVLDIPRVHYYFYLLDLLQAGTVSLPLFLQWVEIVHQRHATIQQMMTTALTSHLITIGRSTPIHFADPLDEIGGIVLAAVQKGRTVTVDTLVERLAQHDPYWKLLNDVATFHSLRDLAYVPYIVEILRHSLHRHGEPTRYAIAIEDPMERKMYRQATKWVKEIKKKHPATSMQLLGLYVYPLLCGQAIKGRPFLYGSRLPFTITDKHGEEYPLSSLLDELYNTA